MLDPRKLWLGLSALLVIAALYVAGAWAGYRTALPRLAERGDAALELAQDRLAGQLAVYRYLPAVLARHPDVVASLQGRPPAHAYLRQVADVSGALDIYLMDRSGTTIAASNWQMERSFVGRNFAWRPYFQRAIGGGLGFYHAVGTTSLQRGFYFAHPVRDGADRIIGVLAVKVDLERIESVWRGDREAAFFHDSNGVIFLTNRDVLVLRRLAEAAPLSAEALRQYADTAPVALPKLQNRQQGGHRIWTGLPGSELSGQAIWISRPMPTLGLTGNVLVDTAEGAAQATLWGLLSAASGAAILALGGIVVTRRNALRRQLETEEHAKARLERDVADRTRDLSDANAALRAEVAERVATEAALRDVQDQLVQAGKLKALGEMSAGISHELNQPLAAIQTLADNTEILLDRGDQDRVRGNLSAMAGLAERAGRIIRNLRAFARKEGEPAGEVDLICIVNDAIDIVAPRMRQSQVDLEWDPEARPVMAIGGKVRLQQVVLNLITNAMDAMEGQDTKRLDISVARTGDRIQLSVRDEGPGLELPDQVFDPFFTTKAVGEGLGLGLSISYGIVQSFGGNIRGENCPGGGAVFTVDLPAARDEDRAA